MEHVVGMAIAGAGMPRIERIILARGQRGMDRVACRLPADFCAQAAAAAWQARARVLLTTGFYVAGQPETDGPPGAFFLARGLAACGARVAFVAESETLSLLRALTAAMWPRQSPAPDFLPFPVAAAAASRAHAQQLVATWRPSLVVAIERCGRTARGRYLNMRREDITAYTAQLDELLAVSGAVTIGIGDGGNEIGMGRVAAELPVLLDLAEPAVTATDHLVVAAVSNWGAFGLLAYLSGLAGHELLPGDDESLAALRLLADLGAVHALSRRSEPGVDGFTPDIEAEVLDELRAAILDL